MAELPRIDAEPGFQLCLDDEKLCAHGPIPLVVSSLSGSGLAVLMLKNQTGLLDPSELMRHAGEERPLRLAARIGQRSIAVTALLVWTESAGDASTELELIVDASGASDWPAIVRAYNGAA